MRYLKYLLISLCSALFTAYAMLWLSAPSPLEATTIPPLTVKQDGNELLVWGGWKTVEGYEQPGITAVEIRCSRQRNSCTEAQANLLQHDVGQDLEAQVFEYHIKSWSADRVEAVSSVAMGQCLNRTLYIQVAENAATLSWAPDKSCDGDSGQAALVGDPI